MKTKYLFIACAALLAGLSGCKDADEIQHAIYFTGTETDPAVIYTIDGPQDLGLSVTASAPVSQTTNVTIDFAPELVESYNALYGTNYAALPADSYEMENKVLTIAEGQCRSASGKFSLTSLADFQEGTTYCMPLTIKGTDNGSRVLESCRTIYVIFNRTIITKATYLGSTHYSVPDFDTDPMVDGMKQITLECRVYVDNFIDAFPYISSVIGIEEYFFLRFGDADLKPSQGAQQMQLAGGGFPLAGKTMCESKKWMHIAVTYDGAQIKLYLNGELDGSRDADRGTISLKTNTGRAFFIGYTPQYGRPLWGYISEARVWSRALTANELKNNECYVDPTSEGLVAYWRFNGAGNDERTVPDLTGNGFNALSSAYSARYMENVKCPE